MNLENKICMAYAIIRDMENKEIAMKALRKNSGKLECKKLIFKFIITSDLIGVLSITNIGFNLV